MRKKQGAGSLRQLQKLGAGTAGGLGSEGNRKDWDESEKAMNCELNTGH